MKLPRLQPKRRALAFSAVLALEFLLLAAMLWPHAARPARPAAATQAAPTDELARRPQLESVLSRLADLPAQRLEPESHPLWALPRVEAPVAVAASVSPETPHSLNLIVAGTGGGYAVIDGLVVRRGSRLADGSLVKSIAPGIVTLARPDGGLRTLRVSNRFTEPNVKDISE